KGGPVSITATTLTVNPAALLAGPLGLVGDGANLTLVAGPRGEGDLFITGSLLANGADIGNGGSIVLVSSSAQSFNVMPGATINGVNGIVSASAGQVFGDGGSVRIENSGSGGIGFGAARAVFVDPSTDFGGNGGSIVLLASNGELTFAGAGLSADARIDGDGGMISMT